MLVVLSAAFGAVSASANITEPALSSVGESYATGDDALSLSYEVNIEDNNELSLSNEASIEDNNRNLSLSNDVNIDDDEILGLSIDESFEDYNGTLRLSNIEENAILGWGQSVQTLTDGCDYVKLSNGYTGFCAKRESTFPKTGTQYLTDGQYILTHEKTGVRVDNKIRLAIIHYADKPEFQEKIRITQYTAGAFSRTQQLIWYLSNFDALAPYSLQYLEKDPILKNAYYDIINRHNNGEWINEEGATYNNGTHEIKYEFLAFKSTSTYQTLVGYKKTIKEIPQIPKVPGMDVTKKSLTPNVKSGEQTKFLITVRNTGELDLSNVFVKENMPADLEYADYTNKNLWRKDGDFF